MPERFLNSTGVGGVGGVGVVGVGGVSWSERRMLRASELNLFIGGSDGVSICRSELNHYIGYRLCSEFGRGRRSRAFGSKRLTLRRAWNFIYVSNLHS